MGPANPTLNDLYQIAAETWRIWRPPEEWGRVAVVELHTEGEPLRVILSGFSALSGATILERRRYAKEYLEPLRTALMWEPRGHANMYGCILTPPVTPDADFGVLFTHNDGYSTMCGHGIIAVTRAVLELGLFPIEAPVTTLGIDSPAGFIRAYARIEDGSVASVAFHNVPSFVVALDQVVDVPGVGHVTYDLAFGGAFYAYVKAQDVGLRCISDDYGALVEKGMAIKRAVQESRGIEHPTEADLGFLYGTIFIGPPEDPRHHSRNVCVFADGEVDRSPTGTGVSGRLAIHHARGEVSVGQSLVIESIIGSRFVSRVVEETTFGPYPAVIPEIEGRAYITGRSEFFVDPRDPLGAGFFLR